MAAAIPYNYNELHLVIQMLCYLATIGILHMPSTVLRHSSAVIRVHRWQIVIVNQPEWFLFLNVYKAHCETRQYRSEPVDLMNIKHTQTDNDTHCETRQYRSEPVDLMNITHTQTDNDTHCETRQYRSVPVDLMNITHTH